mmetsp:Transcript_93892/g.251261  ORF Transcript_93892/g.251261 Transcript_93892/m.251261 type:complete len:296 (-) Transcript_93892:916-1803(-)
MAYSWSGHLQRLSAQQKHPNNNPRRIHPAHLVCRIPELRFCCCLHFCGLLLRMRGQKRPVPGLVEMQIRVIQLLLRVAVRLMQPLQHSVVVVGGHPQRDKEGKKALESDHAGPVGSIVFQGPGHQADGHRKKHTVCTDGPNESMLHVLFLGPQMVGGRPRVHQWYPAPQPAPDVLGQAIQPHPAQVLRGEYPVRIAHKPPDPDGLAEQVPQPVPNAVVAIRHVSVWLVILCSEEERTEHLQQSRHPIQKDAPYSKPISGQGQPLLESSYRGHSEERYVQHRHKHLPCPLRICDSN